MPHIDAIAYDTGIADHLFESKHEAFTVGVAVGSMSKDIELRGLEAVQADEDASHAETLRWIEQLKSGEA